MTGLKIFGTGWCPDCQHVRKLLGGTGSRTPGFTSRRTPAGSSSSRPWAVLGIAAALSLFAHLYVRRPPRDKNDRKSDG